MILDHADSPVGYALVLGPAAPCFPQLFVTRWNTTYPTHPWVDGDTVQHRWVEMTRDKTTTLKSGMVKRMGLLALHGSWVDVVADDGTPISVTWVASTGNIDGGVHADELKAMVDKGEMKGPCRLVERSATDSSYLVVGTAGNGLSFDKKSKLLRNFPRPGADQPGLVLQVADGKVRPLRKIDNTMERKLLSVELGLESSFDVSLVYALLMDDGHKLLGERTDFVDLRTALTTLKDDRNELMAHEGNVTDKDYARAVDNVRALLKACVDTYSIFDVAWKTKFEEALAFTAGAQWAVADLQIVCRTPADYVKRSHRESKVLCHAQGALLTDLRLRIGKGRLRWLVQAPSGSGKTMLCVKLAAFWVWEELTSRDDTMLGAAHVREEWAVLLLTLSARSRDALQAQEAAHAKSIGQPNRGPARTARRTHLVVNAACEQQPARSLATSARATRIIGCVGCTPQSAHKLAAVNSRTREPAILVLG
jgi:hypothetical protein